MSYPNYGRVEESGSDGLMDYVDEWAVIENDYDDFHKSDRSPNGAPTLRGFSLSDFLIIKNWIGYARGIGDSSIDGLPIEQIGAPRLREAAARRKAKGVTTAQASTQKIIGYNIKPINIG